MVEWPSFMVLSGVEAKLDLDLHNAARGEAKAYGLFGFYKLLDVFLHSNTFIKPTFVRAVLSCQDASNDKLDPVRSTCCTTPDSCQCHRQPHFTFLWGASHYR